MKETARKATNTGGMKGTSLKKEKMKSWSKSKEGVALIDVALSLGLNASGSASKSVDTAEAFINDAYEKKDELMDLGRKLIDKKSYEAGEKALDLQADISKFVSDNAASFEKSVKDVMRKDSQAAERGRQATPETKEEKSFLDILKEAKESSVKFTSKAVKAVSDKAAEVKDGVEGEWEAQKSGIQEEMFRMIDEGAAASEAKEKSAKGKKPSREDVNKKMTREEEFALADSMSDEELAFNGVIRVPGYTKADGSKVKRHYRKIKK